MIKSQLQKIEKDISELKPLFHYCPGGYRKKIAKETGLSEGTINNVLSKNKGCFDSKIAIRNSLAKVAVDSWKISSDQYDEMINGVKSATI